MQKLHKALLVLILLNIFTPHISHRYAQQDGNVVTKIFQQRMGLIIVCS